MKELFFRTIVAVWSSPMILFKWSKANYNLAKKERCTLCKSVVSNVLKQKLLITVIMYITHLIYILWD